MKIGSIAITAAIFTLGGCTAAVTPMTTADGKPALSVSCDGLDDDWNTCYKAAKKACDSQYKVVAKNESNTLTSSGRVVRRHLVAECWR